MTGGYSICTSCNTRFTEGASLKEILIRPCLGCLRRKHLKEERAVLTRMIYHFKNGQLKENAARLRNTQARLQELDRELGLT